MAKNRPIPNVLARTLALAFAAHFMLATQPGCNGGIHRKGEHQIGISGSFGHAIKGETVWHDGLGRADNAAVAVDYRYFLKDRLAVGGSVTPYRNYNLAGPDAYAGEFNLGVRYYFWEFDLLEKPVGLYGEISGGLMQSSRSVPEDGTHTNFTQDNAVGLEWRLSENVSVLTGYRFRHISNGYVFGSENPAQNDNQVFAGVAITWK